MMTAWQHRVILMLLLSGLAFAAVGVVVAPRGAAYWLALAAAPLIGGVLGFVLGGAAGRIFEARLMGQAGEAKAPPPLSPAALPAPLRAALQTALLPALLGELAGAAERMAPPARAAALSLVQAGATAPEGAPRQALARDLPRLMGALAAGQAASIGEAEALAKHLASPAPRPGGIP
ncbi:hypothetical protein AAFN86_01105 [Roseomonas sp. CAU 1739]|uniref:hypothetical protein n=1 Tax=Roseomonas sp. CAU 1739 TaxID=3140364 RepID=UPI00325BE3D7